MAPKMAASAASEAPGSAVRAPTGSTGLVCVDAAAVLRLNTGRRRVPLEHLGPAPLNRFGQALSGRHVLALAENILKKWGFATYKYEAGWCYEAKHRRLGRALPSLSFSGLSFLSLPVPASPLNPAG